jgi:hypothetical protein
MHDCFVKQYWKNGSQVLTIVYITQTIQGNYAKKRDDICNFIHSQQPETVCRSEAWPVSEACFVKRFSGMMALSLSSSFCKTSGGGFLVVFWFALCVTVARGSGKLIFDMRSFKVNDVFKPRVRWVTIICHVIYWQSYEVPSKYWSFSWISIFPVEMIVASTGILRNLHLFLL